MLTWKEGWTFLQFLQSENLPDTLYYNADNDDKKAIEDIQALSTYYVLRDKNGTIKQALIPLSEELQAHIYRINGEVFLENIPIEYQTIDSQFVVKINSSSVYNDIKSATNSPTLASFFVKTLKDRINFRQDIHKGSIVAMLYKRKFRLGYPFGGIELKVALLQSGSLKRYVLDFDSKHYSEKGEFVEKNEIFQPMKEGTFRISSRFTKKRFHPILKKYRAHLGIDYAAKKGTPVYSSGDGQVIFLGVSRGYGNLIKIKHRGGYLTLYAHLNSFRKGLKNGAKVKKGEFIGRVGTTGLSTGPHLHFGLYKDGIALDPESVVSIETKNRVEKNKKAEFNLFKDSLIGQLEVLINDFKIGRFKTVQYKYDPLLCEISISNIETSFKNRISEPPPIENMIRDEEIREDVLEILDIDKKGFYYSPEVDKLELSEDYQEY
jgi:murein DD-endopeptidase MepM/ murein hydrolase activator NlpD